MTDTGLELMRITSPEAVFETESNRVELLAQLLWRSLVAISTHAGAQHHPLAVRRQTRLAYRAAAFGAFREVDNALAAVARLRQQEGRDAPNACGRET